MSLKQKIGLSLSLMILGYLVSMVYGFMSGRRAESRLYDVSEHLFPAFRQSQVALSSFNQGMKAYEDAVILGDVGLVEEADGKLREAQQALQNVLEMEQGILKKKAELEQTFTRLQAFADSTRTVYTAMADLDLMTESEVTDGKTIEEQAAELAEETVRLRQALSAFMTMLADKLRAELQVTSNSTRQQRYLNMLLFCVVVSVTTIFVSLLITRAVILPINKAIDFSTAIARGDFTARIHTPQRDELGKLLSGLSHMAEHLNSLVGQVQHTGMQVSSSVAELSATAKEQEVTITRQVESTHEMVRAVEEIAGITTELVDTMQQVAAMSQETAEFASSGQTDLNHIEGAMKQMERASKVISGKLEAINEKAGNITTVVTTINKVADQTNLLSLNAAIEAEKAGEYGRGFTVVAREIRRLADQTALATLDIDQMVKEMQSAVSGGVMEIDKFIAEVRHSAEDVEKISTQLTRIIQQIQTLSPRFEDVNTAMGNQSDRAREINDAMLKLSEEMQQTTASFKETFMAMEHLNEAARDLQEGVSQFKVE